MFLHDKVVNKHFYGWLCRSRDNLKIQNKIKSKSKGCCNNTAFQRKSRHNQRNTKTWRNRIKWITSRPVQKWIRILTKRWTIWWNKSIIQWSEILKLMVIECNRSLYVTKQQRLIEHKRALVDKKAKHAVSEYQKFSLIAC